MPRTKKTETTVAQAQQALTETTLPTPATPEVVVPTQDPAPVESLFDETPPAPPAAEQPIVEPAVPSEPSDAAPEGDGIVHEETPPAIPVLEHASETEEPINAPEPIAEEPQAPEQPASAAIEDPEPATLEPTSVAPEVVRFGQVIGLLHRMPLGDVLAHAEHFAAKIEALKYAASTQGLQTRMRATEGRCAPIYFTADDDDEPEHLIAGDDALAAALALGLETVSVVIIQAGDAGAIQSYLATAAGTGSKSTEDDDELVWRANGYHV